MPVPTGVDSLQQSISKLKAMIDGWMNALVADSVNPQPDYSLEGRSVSRVAWRDALQRNIDNNLALLGKFEPYEFNSIEL